MLLYKKGDFTEFVRNQIFSLLRWTATLSTFLIAVSFAILTYQDGVDNPFTLLWFYCMISFFLINVGLTWWRIRRMVFRYYNELDHQSIGIPPKEKNETLLKIQNNAKLWEHITWGFFGAGCGIFIFFLVSYLVP